MFCFLTTSQELKTLGLKNVWIYDMRTNVHFTLKEKTLADKDLEDFKKCYNPDNRFKRKETERFKKFTYKDIIARDKTSLDIFWLKDESLTDLENLPEPEVIAAEITENLQAAIEAFKNIENSLKEK